MSEPISFNDIVEKFIRFTIDRSEVVRDDQPKVNRFLYNRGLPHLPQGWDWRLNVPNEEKNLVFGKLTGKFASRATRYYSNIRFYVWDKELNSGGSLVTLWYVLNPPHDKVVFSRSGFTAINRQRFVDNFVSTNRTIQMGHVPQETFHEFKYEMDSSTQTLLGNLVSESATQSDDYVFKITTDFDWTDGDFGDGNSCWFNEDLSSDFGRFEARHVWRDVGGYAIKFFFATPERQSYQDHRDGLARAWIWPNYPQNGLITIINGYSKEEPHDIARGSTNDFTRMIAKILATYYTFGMKKVSLDTDRSNDYKELVYINGSNENDDLDGERGRAFIIGPISQLEKLQDAYVYRFPVEDTEYYTGSGNREYCEDCGDAFDIDDMTYIDDRGYVCNSCVSDYTECYSCSSYFYMDSITELHYMYNGRERQRNYCENCINQYDPIYCEDEAEWWKLDDVIVTKDGEYHTPNENLIKCSHCNNYVTNDDAEGDMCEECFNEQREMELELD